MFKTKLSVLCMLALLVAPLGAWAATRVPVISSLSPTNTSAGGAGGSMTVNGSYFTSGSVVRWNGSSRTTTYVSATQLKATIKATDLATAGTAQISVYTSGKGGGTSNALTFTINAGTATQTQSALAIATTSVAAGTASSSYSQTLAATGGTSPYAWGTSAGSLPPGVSLSTAGALSGTPTTAGTYSFSVMVTDHANGTATQSYSLTVASASGGGAGAINITPSSLSNGTSGTAYSQTLTATGGTSPYTWGTSGGSLPSGLSLSSAGALSGKPSSAGTYAFSVQAKDSANNTATQSYSLTVGSGAGTAYADWSGIDAMTVGTTYYGDTTPAGSQIGSSNWQWVHALSDHAITVTVANNSTEPLCPSGHNCLVLLYPTSDATCSWCNNVYLSPTYSSWSGDPSQKNGTQSSGGFWYQFYIAIDSTTYNYMNQNNGGGMKTWLNRWSSTGNYQQANGSGSDGGGGFKFDAIGYLGCPSAMLTDLDFSDDVSAGGIIKNCPGGSTTPLITSGFTQKGYMRRDTVAKLGHEGASANGTVYVDTDVAGGSEPWWGCTGKFVGCNAYGTATLGGIPGMGTNDTTVVMNFGLGIRYFSTCTNGCANATMKLVLSNVVVCDYNCVNYP